MVAALIFTFTVLLALFTKALIKRSDEIMLGVFLIGCLILLVRIFALSSLNLSLYFDGGNSISLWLAESKGGLLFTPQLFLFSVLGTLIVKNIYQFLIISTKISLLFYSLCYIFLIYLQLYLLTVEANLSSEIELFNISFAWLFHFLVSFILIFLFEFVFKNESKTFLNIEKDFNEVHEEDNKLLEYVNIITEKLSLEKDSNSWELYFTRGKAYYGLGQNRKSIDDLEKSYRIILASYDIKSYQFNSETVKKIDIKNFKVLEKIFLTLALAYYKEGYKLSTNSKLYDYLIITGDKKTYLDYCRRLKQPSGINTKNLFDKNNFENMLGYNIFEIPIVGFFLILIGVFLNGTEPQIVAREKDRNDILKERVWFYRLEVGSNRYVGEYYLKNNNDVEKLIIQTKSHDYTEERVENNEKKSYPMLYKKIEEIKYIAKGKYNSNNGYWSENISSIRKIDDSSSINLEVVSTIIKRFNNIPNDSDNVYILKYNHNVIEIIGEVSNDRYKIKLKNTLFKGRTYIGERWYEAFWNRIKKVFS